MRTRQRGQNTAEFLIMMTLVVIASIGSFAMLSGEIRAKIAFVATAISGSEKPYVDAQRLTGGIAKENVEHGIGEPIKMDGVDVRELHYDPLK